MMETRLQTMDVVLHVNLKLDSHVPLGLQQPVVSFVLIQRLLELKFVMMGQMTVLDVPWVVLVLLLAFNVHLEVQPHLPFVPKIVEMVSSNPLKPVMMEMLSMEMVVMLLVRLKTDIHVQAHLQFAQKFVKMAISQSAKHVMIQLFSTEDV